MAKQPTVKRVRVKAIRMGYYGNIRRREGSVFLMDEDHYKVKDKKTGKLRVDDKGNQVYCSWVVLADPSEKGESKLQEKEALYDKKSEALASLTADSDGVI